MSSGLDHDFFSSYQMMMVEGPGQIISTSKEYRCYLLHEGKSGLFVLKSENLMQTLSMNNGGDIQNQMANVATDQYSLKYATKEEI